MKTYRLGMAALSVLMILTMLVSCGEGTTADVEKLIIEKEKQVLDEWGKGRTMVFPDNSASEITYFDPSLEKRLNGKEAFAALCKSIEGKFTVDRYDMLDPKVQVYGDVAILTYNLIDYSEKADSTVKTFSWNSTEVYHRKGSDWRIVHSHWSFTKPNIAQTN